MLHEQPIFPRETCSNIPISMAFSCEDLRLIRKRALSQTKLMYIHSARECARGPKIELSVSRLSSGAETGNT